MFSLSAFSQNSNLIIFNNSGQQFFVILNGIKQNSIPKTNVKVEGLSPTAYKVKIIFADGRTGDIDKNIYLDPNMEFSAQIVIKSAKKRSLRLFNMVELNTSPYGNGAETVTFRPNDNASFTDQNNFQTEYNHSNQGSMNTNVSGQTSGNMNSTNQNGSFQTTVNGVPQGNVNADGTYQVGNIQTTVNGVPQGNVNITGTATTTNQTGNVNADGTYQIGSVQTTVNGQPQGNVNVTTNGNQTNTQDGNIQMNIGLNGNIGFNANLNMSGIDPNVSIDMNGFGIPTNVNQTSTTTNGSQTITTTLNGQTTQVTSNVSDNNQMQTYGINGQIQVTGNGMNGQTQTTGTTFNGQTQTHGTNGQVQVTGNGMNGQTQTTGTTFSGQTQTYGTNGQVQMSGNGMNSQTQVTTHTHADGSIHDHNHHVVQTQNTSHTQANNSNGQMIQNPDGTMGCFGAISDVDYIIAGVEEASFSEDQMNYVRLELKTKCVSSDQAYRIVNAFTFDGDKIDMAKLCYDHMVDKQNAKKMLDLFSFSSSKEELKKYFNIK